MLKFSGGYEEFGEFLGRERKMQGHDFSRNVDENIYARQRKIYAKYYPEVFAEARGMARATGLSEKIILWNKIGVSLMAHKQKLKSKKTRGCTIFAVKDGGRMFIGRNYDWMPRTRVIFEKCRVELNGRYAYFAFSDRGTWPGHLAQKDWGYLIEDAVNEKGLYIGLTFSHIDAWNYGIRPLHFVRYAAENCATVEEVLKALKKFPLCSPQNFLVADRRGNAVVIEHYARGYSLVKPDARGVLIKTNHVLSPEIQHLDRARIDEPKHDTYVRFAEAEQLITEQLGEPCFQFTDIWRILRESHYVYSKETIWSLALELVEGRYDLYYDTAMGQKQEKFGF